MNFKNGNASLKIRSVYYNSSVETSLTKEGGIQNLRPVGCRKDQKSLGCIKTVHFRKKLIQCLLPFVISSETS